MIGKRNLRLLNITWKSTELIPNNKAKFINGEEKFNDAQPFVNASCGTAPINASCRHIYTIRTMPIEYIIDFGTLRAESLISLAKATVVWKPLKE